jgi:hypothetical protein
MTMSVDELRRAVSETIRQMEIREEEMITEMQRLRFNLRQVLAGKVPPAVVHGPITEQVGMTPRADGGD